VLDLLDCLREFDSCFITFPLRSILYSFLVKTTVSSPLGSVIRSYPLSSLRFCESLRIACSAGWLACPLSSSLLVVFFCFLYRVEGKYSRALIRDAVFSVHKLVGLCPKLAREKSRTFRRNGGRDGRCGFLLRGALLASPLLFHSSSDGPNSPHPRTIDERYGSDRANRTKAREC